MVELELRALRGRYTGPDSPIRKRLVHFDVQSTALAADYHTTVLAHAANLLSNSRVRLTSEGHDSTRNTREPELRVLEFLELTLSRTAGGGTPPRPQPIQCGPGHAGGLSAGGPISRRRPAAAFPSSPHDLCYRLALAIQSPAGSRSRDRRPPHIQSRAEGRS